VTEASEALRLFFGLVQRQAGGGDAVRVVEGRSAIRAARQSVDSMRAFVRLPSTGGAFVLASTESSRAFAMGLEGLTLSRPVWRLARRVLGAFAPLGLHRYLGLPELAVCADGVGDSRYSVQAGVPGGGQKLIVREWGPTVGEAFWKLGPAGLPAQLVDAEAEALSWLKKHKECAHLAPALLASGSEREVSWIKMSAMAGTRPDNTMGPVVEDILSTLAATKRQVQRVQDSRWFANLGVRLDAIEAGAPALVRDCRLALDAVQRELGDAPLEFWPSHGDFTPWNTRVESGTLRAFDWEFFDSSRPALFDWFHWILQTGVLVAHQDTRDLQADLRAATRLLSAEREHTREALLQLYLVDVLTREEAIMQHERPSFEQVEWLRSARLDLLTRSAA